jgi:hypothetical protein
MAEAPLASSPVPMSVRLCIPAGAGFRAIATALAGKFGEIVGYTDADARNLGLALDRAAADVVATQGGGDGASLEIEFSRRDSQVTINVRCADQTTRIVRPLP